MKKPTKIDITETLNQDLAPYEFERDLGDLIKFLTELAQQHGNDAYLDWNPNYHYSRYDHEPSPRFLLLKKRPETDAEYNLRVDKETAEKKQIADRELAELERLQKKYGQV